MKLGKRPPKIDPRTFKLEKYLPASLPPPPTAIGWYSRSWSLPMMLNDNLGDCVIAASGHMIQQWTSYTGTQVVPTDDQILKGYEDVGGYNPADPSTDQGCVMIDALNYWRKTGIAGHKILGYAELNMRDHVQVMQSLLLFGNVYIGVQLPISVQGALYWSVPPGGATGNGSPGSWGGHCVPIVSAGPEGLKVITWGSVYGMTWEFYDTYADEAEAVFSPDWMESNNQSANRFDMAALRADLAAL